MFLKIKEFLRPKENYATKINHKNGYVMFFILLSGYLLFVLNWILATRLAGDPQRGFIKDFFGNDPVNNVTTQAVTYSLTFVRGFATLFVAYIMVKISHKYAVVIAMTLLTATFPTAFVNNYGLFIAGRMIMAIGGTMLIIFIQPVLSRFFNPKARGYLSIISPWGYSLGSLIAFLPFIEEVSRNWALDNWRLVAGIVGGLTYVPLFLYILFGKNFNIVKKSESSEVDEKLKPATYKAIIKEKQTWVWILFYGLWLVLAVLWTLFVPRVIIYVWPEFNGLKLGTLSWRTMWSIVFYIGSISGFFIGFWNRTNAKRKPFGIFLASLIILFVALSFLGAGLFVPALTLVGSFAIGLLSKGAQSVFLYIPHEYQGNSPKRITIFFSYIWGFGYIFYTIINIISAQLLDSARTGAFGKNGGLVPLVFILSLIVLFLVLSFFVKEAKPNAPIIDQRLKFWKKFNRKTTNNVTKN